MAVLILGMPALTALEALVGLHMQHTDDVPVLHVDHDLGEALQAAPETHGQADARLPREQDGFPLLGLDTEHVVGRGERVGALRVEESAALELEAERPELADAESEDGTVDRQRSAVAAGREPEKGVGDALGAHGDGEARGVRDGEAIGDIGPEADEVVGSDADDGRLVLLQHVELVKRALALGGEVDGDLLLDVPAAVCGEHVPGTRHIDGCSLVK